MNTINLSGSNSSTGSTDPIQARRVFSKAEDISDDKIKEAISDNNKDEIVIKQADGERIILYADELSTESGEMPEVGDNVKIAYGDGTVKVEGEVLFVDDEWNESYAFALGGLIGHLLAGTESDEAIKAISVEYANTDFTGKYADLKDDILWAKELETLVQRGQRGVFVDNIEDMPPELQAKEKAEKAQFEADVERYTAIYNKLQLVNAEE